MKIIINENVVAKISPLKRHFPEVEALVIPLLHAIQDEHGYISKQAMKEAADYLQLPIAKIREVSIPGRFVAAAIKKDQ